MFFIASALLRRAGAVCLVEQQGPYDPMSSWMLPGGRVEHGEGVLTALHREVGEETGLAIIGMRTLAFLVEVASTEGVYTAMTFDCEAAGALAPVDPDGFVRVAEWVAHEVAIARLSLVEWYDVLPLQRYLGGDARPGATYRFPRT